MRLFSLAVVALALFSLAPATDAQTVVPWMTVDGVNVYVNGFQRGAISVSGVVEGQTTPSSRTYAPSYTTNDASALWSLEACHRSLLLALAKPGQYRAKIDQNVCRVELIAP